MEKTYRVSFKVTGGDVVRVHQSAASREDAKIKAQEIHQVPAVVKVTASVLR